MWLRLILGMRQKHTQGTLLIETPLLQQIAPSFQCEGYLRSTVFVAMCRHMKADAVEPPVAYEARSGSNARVLKDSSKITAGLLLVAWRMRRLGPGPSK